MRLKDIFNNERYTLITDSQELDPILAELGITQFADEITGALIDLDQALQFKYQPDIWLTESVQPWSTNADYERPGYYADASEEELFLQDD